MDQGQVQVILELLQATRRDAGGIELLELFRSPDLLLTQTCGYPLLTQLQGQVTLSRERPSEEYKAGLESCTEEMERLSRIVSDMLFLAQVSHPAARAGFAPVSLAQEARRVMELFALSAEDKHITLSLRGDAWVTGDRLMIQRAISNLLSNAIRLGNCARALMMPSPPPPTTHRPRSSLWRLIRSRVASSVMSQLSRLISGQIGRAHV